MQQVVGLVAAQVVVLLADGVVVVVEDVVVVEVFVARAAVALVQAVGLCAPVVDADARFVAVIFAVVICACQLLLQLCYESCLMQKVGAQSVVMAGKGVCVKVASYTIPRTLYILRGTRYKLNVINVSAFAKR